MKTLLPLFLASFIALQVHAQVPVKNSYPVAKATVYLDFDGQYVQGTSWNWSGPIDAQPALLSTSNINEIFNRVSEDFGIFNLNITTDSSVYLSAPRDQRTRVIVTPTSQWYGPAGGVSFVGSFRWGNETPAWVFSSLLGNEVKKVAEAISHEAGHSLGLQHQSLFDGFCKKTKEYAAGQGTGQTGWAPIMGVGYYKNITTWHNGTSAGGCTSFQNDINVIAGAANNFGLRSDDHLDLHTAATPISFGIDFSASGIINSATDRDVFRFDLGSISNLRLSVVPQSVGSGNEGANVDIKLALLDEFADTIGRYNPVDLLHVGLDTNLDIGTYYLVVDGVANANLNEYGSVGFYTISGALDIALPVHRLLLTGKINEEEHMLDWTYDADEPIKEIHLESSLNGKQFNFLASLPADSRSFLWKPLDYKSMHYRLKLIVASDERAYYSNIIVLRKPLAGKSIAVLNHFITGDIQINTNKPFSYQVLDETGRLLKSGQLRKGLNHIPTSFIKNGILFVRLLHGNEVYTEKFIKR